MRRLVLISLLAVAAPAWPARAAVAVPATVEELARSSDAVVRGRVVKTSARRSTDGRRISTYAEIETTSVWQGKVPQRFTVVVPGGVLGDLGQHVAGAPTFSQDEEVVLFLKRTDGPAFRVRGLGQGKFRVAAGQAHPALSQFTFVPRSRIPPGERRVEPMDSRELEARVRAAR